MKAVLPILLMCILTSCVYKTKRIDQTEVMSIPIDFHESNKTKLSLSDFVDSVAWIPLEFTSESIIGKISHVYFTNNSILIVDSHAGTLLFFDMNGQYRYKIDHRGKGPGEYVRICHARYDSRKQRIMVYDDILRKLIFYDMRGNLIKEIRDFNERYVVRDLTELPDGRFLCYADDGVIGQGNGIDDRFVGLWLTDSTGQFICNLLHYDILYPRMFNTYRTHLHPQSNGDVFLMDPILSDIYLFSNDTLHQIIRYDIQGPKATDYPGMEITDLPWIHASLSEWKGNYLYSCWVDDAHKIIFSLFNRREGTFKSAPEIDLDIRGALSAVPVYSNMEKAYVSVASESILTQLLNSNALNSETKEQIKNLLIKANSTDTENMNPVLQLWFVKP